MDCIKIDGLKIFAYHGVLSEEQKLGQYFLLNIKLYTNTRPAGKEDDLSLSVDYSQVSHRVTEWVTADKKKLIETVAEDVATRILSEFELVRKVTVEVEKPQAPIGLPVRNVSVEITREKHKVFLSIGSNMGDKKQYLEDAIKNLEKETCITVKKTSEFLVTKPYGGVEQDDFLNGAIEIETILPPEELLDVLHEIERKANRTREIHWGPRTLDLDIIFYDDLVYESDSLVIPHVDMENRDFVLKPLMELCPNKRHPLLNKTVTQLYTALQER